jgi:threonine 3-dehydrogenase
LKAVAKTSTAHGFELIDMAVPEIGSKEVLFKVKATAICGSDIHAYESSPGMLAMMKLPVVLGHETCGEVVEVGSACSHLKKGDIISPEPHIFDGTCYYCQNDAALNCANLELFGLTVNGAFAEYAKVPEHCCWKHDKSVSGELGALFEPLGVGTHGVMSGPVNGKTVAVFGCGPIGLFAIGAASVFGATKVIAVEIAPKRLAMVDKIIPGVLKINPKEQDPVKAIQDATDGLGVDVAIELTGNPGALKQALKSLRREGRLSIVGVQAGPLEIEVQKDIVLKEATVRGVFGREVWRTWWQVRSMLSTKRFDPTVVITHRFPLAEYAKAIELAASGQAGKILLIP